MKFIVKKEDLLNGLRITSGIAATRSLQPVLANVLIETVAKNKIQLTTTDNDLIIRTEIDAQIEEEGSITLPAKKLNDIALRMKDNLIVFELEEETNTMKINSNNTKFDILGISSEEFPDLAQIDEFSEKEAIEMNLKTFVKAVKQTSFAAATYETNNLLSGIYCSVSDNVLEMASTDGNRLVRTREKIETKDNTNAQLIIPSKTLSEFIKITTGLEDETIFIQIQKTKLFIKTKTILMVSRIMEGQYPKYNQLIPKDTPKTAIVNRLKFIEALETLAVIVDDKTNIMKLEFEENKLKLTAETPNSGKGEDNFAINYEFEKLKIGFNYKYILDGLRNNEDDEIKVHLNTNLSPTIFSPNSEKDYLYLIMPVQIRE